MFKRFPDLKEEPEEFADRVMQCLAYERRAEDELLSMCSEVAADCVMMMDSIEEYRSIPQLAPTMVTNLRNHSAHATEIANLMYRLGSELHALLRELRLYRDGYLHYQFAGWVGHDMLLSRLLVPVLSTRVPIDYLTDDDLWVLSASRRNRRR
jgi:hypothetical protein